jgi:hypothetical protein
MNVVGVVFVRGIVFYKQTDRQSVPVRSHARFIWIFTVTGRESGHRVFRNIGDTLTVGLCQCLKTSIFNNTSVKTSNIPSIFTNTTAKISNLLSIFISTFVETSNLLSIFISSYVETSNFEFIFINTFVETSNILSIFISSYVETSNLVNSISIGPCIAVWISRNNNKVQTFNKIHYYKIYWRLNMFRAAYRSSSEALNCICSLWFTYPCGDSELFCVQMCSVWLNMRAIQ